MTRKTHVVAGVATVLLADVPLIGYLTRQGIITDAFIPAIVCGVAGGYIGSILPDLDYPTHLATKSDNELTPQERNLKYNHRGGLHSLILPIIIILFNLSQSELVKRYDSDFICNVLFGRLGFFDGVVIAYLVHLLADMFTLKGVRIGWPILRENISFTKIKLFRILGESQSLWLIFYLFILFIFYAIYYKIATA